MAGGYFNAGYLKVFQKKSLWASLHTPLHVNKISLFLEGGERKKKRKSRWGTEEKRTFIPGMPTTMPPNLSPDQQQAYIGKSASKFLKLTFLMLVVE